MAEQDFDKTEQATPKRKQEAREKGSVARSHEIPSVAILLMGTVILYFIFPRVYSNFMDLTSSIFSVSGSMEITEDIIYLFVTEIIKKMFFTLSPFLFMVVIAGAVSNILQFGLIFSTKSLELDLSRIDPIEGIKRLTSLRSLVEIGKAILKIAVVGFAASLLIRREFDHFIILVDSDINHIFSYTGRLTLKLITWTGSVLVVLAAVDFGFKKWEHTRSLKMTPQEVKEEFRQTEGNPLIKSRIKSLQREMARKRMMSDVPKADVVITNPIHLAVAILYKNGEMKAPKVVAKGAGVIAEKIKEIARENGVVIIENKPLAQTLYRIVKIGEEIPSNLYKAVAEILAYVYRLKRKK